MNTFFSSKPYSKALIVGGLITWLLVLLLSFQYYLNQELFVFLNYDNNNNNNFRGFTEKVYKSPNSSNKRIEFERPCLLEEQNNNTVIVLVLVGQHDAYGSGRTFEDFFTMVAKLYSESPMNLTMSFGFLSNSEAEFNGISNYIRDHLHDFTKETWSPISRITVITNPDLDKGLDIARSDRHDDAVQRVRRRFIAKNRNFLVFSALKDEDYILFVDSDVIKVNDETELLNTFIQSGKDIMVPRIIEGGIQDYDRNSWRGRRYKPTAQQEQLFDEGKFDEARYFPDKSDIPGKMFHFKDYLEDPDYDKFRNDPDYNFPLDAVGGAILFLRGIVFKLGAVFPTSYIVGTTWDRTEGYDGIETEGLCYLAGPLGYSCWGFPNRLAYHRAGY